MKKIYHFTNGHCAKGINRTQKIELEGRQLEKLYDKWVRTGEIDRLPLKQVADVVFRLNCNKSCYNKMGRYVWFSEEPAATANGADYGYEFDAKEIGAVPWTEVKKKVLRNASCKAKKLIKNMDRIAREDGDDPTKYWVLDRELSLTDVNYQFGRVEDEQRSVA